VVAALPSTTPRPVHKSSIVVSLVILYQSHVVFHARMAKQGTIVVPQYLGAGLAGDLVHHDTRVVMLAFVGWDVEVVSILCMLPKVHRSIGHKVADGTLELAGAA
jgi:hypothetical protein